MTEQPDAGIPSDPSSPPPVTDPVGLALTAIGAGAAAGASVIVIGLAVLRTLQGSAPATGQTNTTFGVLAGAILAGPVVTVLTSMTVTSVIPDLWRRSVASAIAVFCTFLLSGLAAPVDMVAGRTGLFVFSAMLVVAAVAAWRRATRIRTR